MLDTLNGQCLSDGYNIAQVSEEGRCLVADTMKDAAPEEKSFSENKIF